MLLRIRVLELADRSNRRHVAVHAPVDAT
jgi:hypothetical protein